MATVFSPIGKMVSETKYFHSCNTLREAIDLADKVACEECYRELIRLLYRAAAYADITKLGIVIRATHKKMKGIVS